MRNAFAEELCALAGEDPRVVLLAGDIGNRLFNPFKERFPGRFFNCGVAEANLVGVAAGMAREGLRPVAYTIAPFVTYRCLEQVRVDLCYHRAPAVLVGVGGGLSYASLGSTHHALEDVAVMRALPDIAVACPGDAWEVRALLRAALRREGGPTYLRIGKKGEPEVHTGVPDLDLGAALTLRVGDAGGPLLLANGTVLPLALAVADHLAGAGVSAGVASFPSVKPLDEAFLEDALARHAVVATLEEHSCIGGFGAAVAEFIADRAETPRARLLRLGTPDAFVHRTSGDQAAAREALGITVEGWAARIAAALAPAGGTGAMADMADAATQTAGRRAPPPENRRIK